MKSKPCQLTGDYFCYGTVARLDAFLVIFIRGDLIFIRDLGGSYYYTFESEVSTRSEI